MAKVINTPAQNKPEQKEITKNKNGNMKYTIIGIFTAAGIILLVFAITFTIILKSNTAGLADKYRTSIQGIPILKYALPKAIDPEDAKNLTLKELTDKYNVLRKEKQGYLSREQDLNSQIDELLKYKVDEEKRTSDATIQLTEATNLKKQVDDANVKLEADRKAFDAVVANADKQGFRTFYEQLNKETAQKVYAEIITGQKISDDTKKYVQIYEQMDTKAASKILEQLGKTKMDLVVEILKTMNKEKVSKILPEMSTDFAVDVSQRLSVVYIQK